ncbi:hypothetical protein WA158_000185 [Blastocystis sp. Blastoise]
MQQNYLPEKTGANDLLRDGFNDLAPHCDIHPVQKLTENEFHNDWNSRVKRASVVGGPQAAFRMQMEKRTFSRPLRLIGLPNSYSEMNTLLGRDDEITFNDMLGDWTHHPISEGL